MIGDGLAAGNFYRAANGDFAIWSNPGINRLDISHNQSPALRDRVYVDYRHYDDPYASGDVLGTNRNGDLNLYTFGAEYVAIEDFMSIDFRIPFASMSQIDQPDVQNGLTGTSNDVGNLSVIFKFLLEETIDEYLLTAGFAFTLPTGADASIGDSSVADPPLQISNDSLYFSPFLLSYYAPNPRWFTQTFLSFDFSLKGDNLSGANLVSDVSVAQQHLFKLDYQLGYWLFKEPSRYHKCTYFQLPTRGITGIAAIAELHYTTTLNNADTAVFAANRFLTTSPFGQYDVLNAVAGTTINWGKRASLTAGYAIPISNVAGNNNIYDHQFIVQYNLFFPTSEVVETQMYHATH